MQKREKRKEGLNPCQDLKSKREGKRRGKRKKKLSTESNLGPTDERTTPGHVLIWADK